MERQEYDLFPLILGLTLASAGAFGWYLAVGARHAPTHLAATSARSPLTATVEPSPLPQVSSAAPLPAVAVPPAALPNTLESSTTPAASVDPNPTAPRIWRCDINGQRVFADFKCASDAKPTELAAINQMHAAPVPPRRYLDYPMPAPVASGPEYYETDETASATPAYATYPVVYSVRPRPLHPHRPPQHAPTHHGDR